jgi:type I restriction-modification system DNA methylase subunit
MNSATSSQRALEGLRSLLDAYAGRYLELNGARSFGDYLARDRARDDEEMLTEEVLRDLLEQLLGFPRDAYFPQRGRGLLKPDFTPNDLIAHPFVLDAKSSTQELPPHEPQIRRYIDQRQLDYGVLFNLREVRVYRRGEHGHVREVSFLLLPLWQQAIGEAMPDEQLLTAFSEFRERFAHRRLGRAEKVAHVRSARPWAEREDRGDVVEVDIEFLVDRLRALSRRLQADAADQFDALRRQLDVNPGRERSLLRELELLALDLAPGTRPESLPRDVAGYRDGNGLPARAWRQYLLRVSQLALTRILLYRSWEDVEFVDSYLYDGGFERWYERLGADLQQILRSAFAEGRERYHWLYGQDNNYDWYRPRDDALVEVLYNLAPIPLGKLDADVLGGLYESYVEDIDRDRLGQFYTPRAVVRFMLDRAGFAGQDVFRIRGDRREPRELLDFATGSGGFLVEAARRVIDEGRPREDDPRDLGERLAAVVRGFHGCEISPFPYYLTEVNLLLQVSRILGRMRAAQVDQPTFVLGVVHADTLTTRREQHETIEGLGSQHRLDRGELAPDERFGLVPLDLEKQDAFRRMREDAAFDLVIGNPPYVFESNNKILFDRLRALPAWRDVYRGKSDYLYYFLLLAAEKVRPGGRLCVITPAGWMNAGNAGWLRERIASSLRLDELFLFGSYRLFAPERPEREGRFRAPTPTVESAILVATKAPVPRGHELKIVALEDESQAAIALTDDREARSPARDELLRAMDERARGRAGRRRGIHVHRLRQQDLEHALPWPIKHARGDVAAQVVAHLDRASADVSSPVEPLGDRWEVVRGIETGADAYTRRIQRRLSDSVKRRLAAEGADVGDPIMELPPGWEGREPWHSHPELLAHSVEPRAIVYGAVDEANYTNLIWIGRDQQVPEAVVTALERWRPVLASRAEFVRNPKRRWFETAWPRDRDGLRAPKVIALYRTDRGRFAVDERGDWQPSNKATICTARQHGLSVAYLCGLLNSELLDLWYAVRGKTPWHVRRNYEPKPMLRMPYRHVDSASEATQPLRLTQLDQALQGRDPARARALADAIAADLSAESGIAAEAAGAVERLVRALAHNRRDLLSRRPLVRSLDRTIKDPWRMAPVELDSAGLVGRLAAADTVSVRLDPELSVEFAADGPLGVASQEKGTLAFGRRRRISARVTGPPDRLELLAKLVAGSGRLMPAGLEGTLLPKDLGAFHSRLQREAQGIQELLDEGRALVEAVERLVCRLYGVSADLEEAVIEHAARRAAAALSDEIE